MKRAHDMLVSSPSQALLQLISSLMLTASLLSWCALSLKILLGLAMPAG